ncbi:glutamate racemase [Psychromonas marina]|uniref:Glutamate racemase n=1 Tax=Psychromonas marina TaxID=88364 RepID=A0ABQ6E485_9GAMM|nr:glutamate racemase [Psychromonas marina]GLS92272.1 glutamate racemase [Psychromonas marina]
MSVKRILIFDSGVGGLSVYEQIVKLNPCISCHYLFDNAYFPYGELPRTKLVERLTQLLADFMSQHPVDLVVIACNSASTVALEALRLHFSIPIVGVVPAIKPATRITTNNVIGLLATPATIERIYTRQLINEFAAGKTVLRIGSTELVKLAEDKLIGKPVALKDFKAVLAPWLSELASDQKIEGKEQLQPDTLVLGCTHFPLIKAEIAACFTRPIKLVDSGEAIALRVKQLLEVEQHNPSEGVAEIKINQAFYTQHFSDQQHLSALCHSFSDYGFQQVNFCGL